MGIADIKVILSTILSLFIGIVGLRVYQPIAQMILDFVPTGFMKATMTVIVWLSYIVVLYFIVYTPLTRRFGDRDQVQSPIPILQARPSTIAPAQPITQRIISKITGR